MGDRTRIEWAQSTWNPIVGCTPISAGCEHCYAARMAKRLAGRCGYPEDWSRPTLRESALDQPLQWKKPRRIFVCSMGDLFHPGVDPTQRMAVFNVMRHALRHTFMVLTKRPENITPDLRDFPPNAWAGVTVESQDTIRRLVDLKKVNAPVRFVSAEPLLGPLDLSQWLPMLRWVIVGGETGPGARPMHPDWVRGIRNQCQMAGVPFFFKHWGAWKPDCLCGNREACKTTPRPEPGHPGCMFHCTQHPKNERLLDGREWNESPEVVPLGTTYSLMEEP